MIVVDVDDYCYQPSGSGLINVDSFAANAVALRFAKAADCR